MQLYANDCIYEFLNIFYIIDLDDILIYFNTFKEYITYIPLKWCKGSMKFFKSERLHKNISQQDRRFSFHDAYLISMKLYSKELLGWLWES